MADKDSLALEIFEAVAGSLRASLKEIVRVKLRLVLAEHDARLTNLLTDALRTGEPVGDKLKAEIDATVAALLDTRARTEDRAPAVGSSGRLQ